MKKLLTAIALLGVASFAFGQGQVNFVNTATTLVSVGSGGPALAGTATGAGEWTYGIFWAPLGTADTSAFSVFGYTSSLATAGRFNGGAGAAAPAIAGQAIGSSVQVLVRGWNAAADGPDNSWAAVQARLPEGDLYLGQSGVATIILGGGATPIQTPFGNLSYQIPAGFTMEYIPVVPEPGSFALAGLGAAALLIFRRRN